MSWTTDREEKLKELWKKGHTASQIAEILGGTTRNAVIGKAHRLNLETRGTSKKQSAETFNKMENDALKSFEKENPKKLEELTDDTCRWPIGHPYEEKFYFCGRKSMAKFPYCKLHVLYAFQPKNAKEEDIITEEDLPVYEKKIKSA